MASRLAIKRRNLIMQQRAEAALAVLETEVEEVVEVVEEKIVPKKTKTKIKEEVEVVVETDEEE